jgi:acetyl esterase/lipase
LLAVMPLCRAAAYPDVETSALAPVELGVLAGGDPFAPPVDTTAPPAAAPGIASWTRIAEPGESVVLGGHGFTAQTRFVVFGHAAQGRLLADAQVVSVTPYSAHLRLPQGLPAHGLYLIWPQNGNAAGRPVAINRAEPWWVNPRKASRGETVSVYGRNLSWQRGEEKAWVYLQPKQGAGHWAKVTAVNPYKVDFVVPDTLGNGDCEVWVHNGHGGRYGWQALHQAPRSKTTPTTLQIQDPLRWDGPRINVKEAGAVGDGRTDDTAAIVKALEGAGAQPRATLWFPAGTYLISQPIAVTGMRVLGDGMDKTFIKGNPASLPTTMLSLAGNDNEVRGITFDINELGETVKLYRGAKRPVHDPAYFARQAAERERRDTEKRQREAAERERVKQAKAWQAAHKGEPLPAELQPPKPEAPAGPKPVKRTLLTCPGPGSGLRLIDCVFDAERQVVMNLGGREDVLLSNCDIVGQECQIATVKHARIDKCNFYGRGFAGVLMYAYGGWCVSVTDCTGQDYKADSVDTCQGRFFTVSAYGQRSENLYLGGNRTTDMTVDPIYYNQNTGEQIMWEFLDPISEQTPAAVDGLRFTLPAPIKEDRVAWYANAVITAGRGMGQYRQVMRCDPATGEIEIDHPWEVAPDADSRILICRTVNRVAVYKNVLDAKPQAYLSATHIASAGVETFGGSLDFVVDGNTFHELRSGIAPFNRPTYFHTYLRNTFDTGRWGVKSNWRGSDPKKAFTGAVAFGVMTQRNTFRGIVENSILADAPLCVAEGNTGTLLDTAYPTRSVVYDRVGDRALPLHVFTPDGAAPAGRRTAVILIHGGGWGAGKPEMLFPVARALAQRNVTALVPGYRLTSEPGVGIDECVRDTRTAVRWVRDHAAEVGADPARLVVLGESAGGHLATLVDTLVAARVLVNPVLDLTTLKWCANVPGIKGTADAATRLEALSPVLQVQAGASPTLVLHGEKDDVVPIEQADRYVAAMRKAGNLCDMTRLPDVGHAFFVPAYGREPLLAQGLAEVERFLRARNLLPPQR